jgi:carboxypeptidase family protein
MRFILPLVLCGILFIHRDSLAQSPARTDTIQGRVVTDSAVAIAGATVSVTRAPDRAFLTATTDSLGGFKIIFADGTGDYLVHAAMTGFKADRQRILRQSDGSLPTVTFKLASSVQKLATVQIQSSKPTPDRTSGLQVETGEAARIADGMLGAVPPDLAGNLQAIALTVPGVSQIAGGISVLGMGSQANSATLNGMAFSGASLPRDAHTTTRIATSTYDPARGGFSGAQTSVELDEGNIYSRRTAHISIDDPALQYGGAAGSGPNERFRNLQLSAGGDGTVIEDKFPFNYGVEGGLRGARLSSFENASARELSDAGITSTSAARLLQALGSRGILVDQAPISSSTQNFSMIGRVDRAPYDWETFKPSKTSWGILGFGSVDNQTNAGISALTTASTARDFRNLRGGIQALYSTFINPDHLAEVKTGITLDQQRDIPRSLLPLGLVNLQAQADGPDSTFSTVEVGGPGTAGSTSRGVIWETIGSTEFYPGGKPDHYLRFTGNARIESRNSSSADNSLGSFFYNSVGDLELNRPSEFDRVLSTPERNGSETSGFIAASDSWRVKPMVRILYGARFEGNRFGDVPALNRKVFDAFGERNDNAPNSFHVSPRIGFTWRLNDGYNGYMMGPLGQFQFSNARYIRGGIGEFRNSLPADLLETAATNTGLPEAVSSVRCVGSAVPIPDWSSFNNEGDIPRDCVGGAAARSVFADAAPHVELFSRSYSPERSWRANLGYSSKIWFFSYTIDGNYSLGLSLPDYQNLNFSAVPRFTTDEGRSVFVSRDAIDPLSGAVSPVESRLNESFGSVISRVSSGTSRTGQVTLSVAPHLPWFMIFHGSYTLMSSQATFGGFGASTFESPLIRETSRSDFDSRHQFLVQTGALYRGFSLTLFTRIQSGLPFTPVVSGDVNGDGIANDRAFIVSASAPSSSVANGMKAMLVSAPDRVKSCLEPQSGRPAKRNSCDGPWTSYMTAQITSQHNLPFVHQRGHAALAFSNPLGGIDRLLHGPNGLHGWGSTMSPDPNLYIVRGFDPAASRFIYDVNPRFGRSRLSDAFNRTPFRVTLDISLDIGTPMPLQSIQRFLTPGRNGDKRPRLSASDLKKRYQRTVNDPYEEILQQTDSLLLSREQSEAITAEDARYRAGMDSIWTAAAEKLAALPDVFDAKIAVKLQEDASDAAWEYSRISVKRSLGRLLSPLQIELEGGLASMLYRAKKPVQMRSYF